MLQKHLVRRSAVDQQRAGCFQQVAFHIPRERGMHARHVGKQRNVHISVRRRLSQRYAVTQANQEAPYPVDPEKEALVGRRVHGVFLLVLWSARRGGDRLRFDGPPCAGACLAAFHVLRSHRQHLLR